MAKTTSTGVFQLPNGTWGFRYALMLDGKQKDIRRNKDENGNPFKTERAAIKAREATIIQVQAELLQPPKPTKKRMTVAGVFKEYCETGRCGKAYGIPCNLYKKVRIIPDLLFFKFCEDERPRQS